MAQPRLALHTSTSSNRVMKSANRTRRLRQKMCRLPQVSAATLVLQHWGAHRRYDVQSAKRENKTKPRAKDSLRCFRMELLISMVCSIAWFRRETENCTRHDMSFSVSPSEGGKEWPDADSNDVTSAVPPSTFNRHITPPGLLKIEHTNRVVSLPCHVIQKVPSFFSLQPSSVRTLSLHLSDF